MHHGQCQNLLASARTLVDVEPFYLGRHPSAAQSERLRAVFRELHVPLPNVAIWISIPIHLLGGMALLVGFKTRWAAALLAQLCVGTAFGVHLPIGDQDNMIHFYKNLVMTGGFLYVIAFGAGAVSIDGKAG
jgi:putative oxidoreductase